MDLLHEVTRAMSQRLGQTATSLAEEVRDDFDWKQLPRDVRLGWPLRLRGSNS
jgi:hypothetical protein